MSAAEISLPASVIAEITAPCRILEGEIQMHRIWIHRDGNVETPDHEGKNHGNIEEVVEALGGDTFSTCGYWKAAHGFTSGSGVESEGIPDRSAWRFTYSSFWTARGMWTANSAILGVPCVVPNDPVAVLAYTQVYLRNGGELPDDPVTHIGYLASPWSRAGGWRRSSQVSPSHLEALLAAGIPASRAASTAALDLPAEAAQAAVSGIRRLALPLDFLVNLLHALPATRALAVLHATPANHANTLVLNLSRLGDLAIEGKMSDSEIEEFLLSYK